VKISVSPNPGEIVNFSKFWDLAVHQGKFVLKGGFSEREFKPFRGLWGSLQTWDNTHTHTHTDTRWGLEGCVLGVGSEEGVL